MPALKLLILDATEVIYLHERQLWPAVVSRCEVHLAQTVTKEASYYEKDGINEVIDLNEDINSGRVKVFGLTASEVKQFFDGFDPIYRPSLDPGEAESLAYLVRSKETFSLSSGDAIVYRILGLLGRGDQGVSLEEVLQKIGLGRAVEWQHTRQFRERYTKEGQQDSIQGRGLKR